MAESNRGELGPRLAYRSEAREGGTWIAISGIITEEADFEPLLARLSGRVTLDVGEISRINSMGTRAWIDFVRGCEEKGVSLAYERCSPAIVGQMCMIADFMGARSRVLSVVARYACSSCAAEEDRLVVFSNEGMAALERTIPCPRCRSRMDIDDLPEHIELLRRLARAQGR